MNRSGRFTHVFTCLFLGIVGMACIIPAGRQDVYGPHPTFGIAALILAVFTFVSILEEL